MAWDGIQINCSLKNVLSMISKWSLKEAPSYGQHCDELQTCKSNENYFIIGITVQRESDQVNPDNEGKQYN